VARALVLGVAVVFVLFPIYWIAVMSIKPVADYISTPPVFFPDEPTLLHWEAVDVYRGWHGLRNSVIIATTATIIAVVVGTLAGYAIARFGTGGRNLSFWILSQRMLPAVAAVIPIFLLYRGVKLVDTHVGLIVLYTAFALPFAVWMTFVYFRQLPPEIEEAAIVDGASHLQTLWRIVLPLAGPGIVSAAIFSFIFAWTDFMFALFLSSKNAITLPVIVSSLLGEQAQLYGEVSAVILVSIIPAFLLGFIVQRHLARGLTLGAVADQ
jgi:multiple sugar transport system permease protein